MISTRKSIILCALPRVDKFVFATLFTLFYRLGCICEINLFLQHEIDFLVNVISISLGQILAEIFVPSDLQEHLETRMR